MRLLLIRHGDPDYEHDSLTPAGEREAQLLAELLKQESIDHIYMSPLGRAQKTASYTEEALGLQGETVDWLQEFPGTLDVNGYPDLQAMYPDTQKRPDGTYENRIFWDMLPQYLSMDPHYLDNSDWDKSPEGVRCRLRDEYDKVANGLDQLLSDYGYVRAGQHYSVGKESTETIAFFCHFGVSCVLLSHLWNCTPYLLWHSLCMLPSSVTELVTEERERGIASFRALRIGDTQHLTRAGVEPSFSARFCEVYSKMEQRH